MNRRRWVPEVVQTSGMDCGPACLTALARGYGLAANYGRLREACQTNVDGTSIDTLEEISIELGLEAEQALLPVEHLLAPAGVVPGIVVVRQPAGAPHFVVLWSRWFGRAQVMDPGKGRRWIPVRELLRQLYIHEMALPAETWREWAGEPAFLDPLAHRLRALGVRGDHLARATADASWRGLATLDAAVRLVETVIAAGGAATGAEATRLLDGLVAAPSTIAERYWHARAPEDAAGAAGAEAAAGPELIVRGCVQLRVTGERAAKSEAPVLDAAVTQAEPSVWRTLIASMFADRRTTLIAFVLVAMLSAVGIVFETALYRVLFEAGTELVTRPQLLGVLAVLLGFIVAIWLLEISTFQTGLEVGRTTEVKMRVQLAEKLPRLALQYLRTRPIADTAERGHSLHRIRELPPLGLRLIRAFTEALATTLALIWLVPGAWPWIVGLAASAIVPPLVALGPLSERELRMRTHAGAMSWFALDALQGAMPARASGLESTLRREHDGLLVEWARAATSEHHLSMIVAWVQGLFGYGFVIAIVFSTVLLGGRPASLLLVIYWALAVPAAGAALAVAVREIPMYRNATLRLLEPLTAPDSEAEAGALARTSAGVAIELEGVSVVLRGFTILDQLSLTIGAGEHVAIVGLSGGGKSTLLGLVLGWTQVSSGELRVDGAVLDAERLVALRAQTAWIDPAVTLWNDSLANNLRYSVPPREVADVADLASRAELATMLSRLPEGFATRLGEGGGLVSGGEGQRVRLGRGLARRDARLVVMDEPFRGLDRKTRERQLAAARAHWRDATMLCATHDLAETHVFPRVIVVEGGVVIEDGAPAELAAREGSRYAELLARERSAHEVWTRWKHVRIVDGDLEVGP
ncbi:MAG: ATP-binding cassette domain-containing protein [Kofleriaceae bacterium]